MTDATRDDPDVTPLVLLADLKSHLRVTGTAEDTVLTEMLKAASQYTEDLLGRSLVEQAWTWTLDTFAESRRPTDDFWYGPAAGYTVNKGIIVVPRPPLVSVASIKYLDESGVQQTLAVADYEVDATSEPGRIKPSVSAVYWPTTGDYLAAVEVKFTAGYSTLPFRLALAIKMLAGHWYANREAAGLPGLSSVPLGYADLIDDHRVRQF